MFLSKNDMATHAWCDIVSARAICLLIILIIVLLFFGDVEKQAKKVIQKYQLIWKRTTYSKKRNIIVHNS